MLLHKAISRLLWLFFLFLFFSASPAHANTCPSFSQSGGFDASQTINIVYGNCPKTPVTITFNTGGFGAGMSAWEFTQTGPNLGNGCPAEPLPPWITITPSSGSTAGFSVQVTIDPTKGGGEVVLGFWNGPTNWTLGWPAPHMYWYDPSGNLFAQWDEGGSTCFGTGTIITDTSGSAPTGTSLDQGPSCPRSGGENMCGSPINLTNGNTWLQSDDYELLGLGGGISLKRTWNSEWQSNSPWIQAGMFGDSWQSTYEKRMQVLSGGTQLRYWRGDGSAWLFNISKSTYSLASPVDERATLTFSNKNGYTLTLRDGSQEQYNSSGLPTAFLDRNGNTTTLTYDNNNRLTSVKDAALRLLQFNYNPTFVQQVASIQDSVGTIASFTYDSGSHLTSVTYADGAVVNYSYDSNGLLLSATDQLGKVLESHTYDSQRRGLSSQRASGVDSLTVSYSPEGGVAQVTNSVGNATTYEAGDQIGSRRYETGIQGPGCSSCVGSNNQSFSYDGSGNRTSSKDANGNTTNYSYDANGNVTQISKAIGSATQTYNFTWNSFGEVLTATDPLSKVATNTYDSKGNLLTTKSPLGNTTTFTYDTKGELLTIKDPRLNVTTLTYTAAGLIASIKDAQNNLTQFQYDARANRTTVIDSLNQTTSYTYDSRNRLTQITYPTSPSTNVQFGYDYRGRRTSATDANGKVTQYGYDDADRLITVTDAANNVTTYAYDTENNLLSITDASTNKTSFAYDALGRATQTTFPSTLTESYGYDANGNLTSKTDRKSQVINYGYDAANRLTSKTYPDTTSVSYTYDLANHLTQVIDPTGTYGFTFNADGRLTQTSTAYSFIAGHTFTVGYGYDAAANRTSMTDPQNAGTTYVYDTLNRLQTLTSPQGAFGFSYDALSRRTQLTRPNNVTTTYGYDPVSRLLSVLHKLGTTTLDGATYTVDNAGNRLSRTPQPSGTATNFGYDNIYRLLSATGGSTESYTYDAVGNRLTSAAGSYGYNTSNEMTSSPTATFTYDNNGNTLTKVDSTGTTSYAWDFENRLTTVTLPGSGGTVTFKYDPFGRRIQRSSLSGTTNYLYDGENSLEEVDASGNLVARYTQTQDIDEPLAMLRGGTTSFYHSDGLGSITSLSNGTGSLVQSYMFDSFGKQTASSGSLTNPFQYTGRESDAETGVYYYRSRYYDPSVGRFASEDPTGFRGGDINFYVYARQNPILLRDPSGNAYCKFDNCFKVFEKGIKHFSRSDFDARASATPVFYPPSPALSSLTQADVVGGSNTTPLNQSLPYGAGGITIHGPWGSAILLGPNAFIPSNDPDASYLHELIHVYTGLNDDQIFNLFKPYGLKHVNPGSYDITLWIMGNCKGK